MADIIRYHGVVENIDNNHVQVKIVKNAPCAACSAKAHCSSAESQERMIDIDIEDAYPYAVGDDVWIIGSSIMGAKSIWYGVGIPFFLLVFSLFIVYALTRNEVTAAMSSFAGLASYYGVLSVNKQRMKEKFKFSLQPFVN